MKTGEFMLDARQRTLRDANGRVFDLAAHLWRVDEGTVSGRKISAVDALRWLQRDSGHPAARAGRGRRRPSRRRRGPRAGAWLVAASREGRHRGAMRRPRRRDARRVRGCRDRGWPQHRPPPRRHDRRRERRGHRADRDGPRHRAQCGDRARRVCVIAIGGSYGTLSEMALAMHAGKVVSRCAARRPSTASTWWRPSTRRSTRSRVSRSASTAARNPRFRGRTRERARLKPAVYHPHRAGVAQW